LESVSGAKQHFLGNKKVVRNTHQPESEPSSVKEHMSKSQECNRDALFCVSLEKMHLGENAPYQNSLCFSNHSELFQGTIKWTFAATDF